ncbi:unnamed protein product [Symbiodinium sp. CCMP2592]|nr:unnamed protein product [Symbiodinium sp. CCMP2592]
MHGFFMLVFMTSGEPRLPTEDAEFLEAAEGLGNSQKAEVAWLERKGYSYRGVDVTTWLEEDGSEGCGHATRLDVESKPQGANPTPWALPHEIPAGAASDLNQAVGAPANPDLLE